MGDTDDAAGIGKQFSVAEKLEILKPKSNEPRSIRVLDSWIAHAENELGIGRGGRLAWLVASTVVAAKLQQVIDVSGASRFSLKGGTLLQHKLGLSARATKDLDGIVSGDIDDFLRALDEALSDDWGPISFARTEAEAMRVPSRIAKPKRFEMVLSLRGDVWRRVNSPYAHAAAVGLARARPPRPYTHSTSLADASFSML